MERAQAKWATPTSAASSLALHDLAAAAVGLVISSRPPSLTSRRESRQWPPSFRSTKTGRKYETSIKLRAALEISKGWCASREYTRSGQNRKKNLPRKPRLAAKLPTYGCEKSPGKGHCPDSLNNSLVHQRIQVGYLGYISITKWYFKHWIS